MSSIHKRFVVGYFDLAAHDLVQIANFRTQQGAEDFIELKWRFLFDSPKDWRPLRIIETYFDNEDLYKADARTEATFDLIRHRRERMEASKA